MNAYEATQTVMVRRRALGLRAEDVGREAGVRAQTLRDLEAGRSMPKLDTFLDLCDTLGIEVRLVVRESLPESFAREMVDAAKEAGVA